MSPLHQAILNTLAYFDLFEYPLTAMEVWRWLYAPGMGPQNFEKVLGELDSLLEEKKIESKNGFYFLPDRAVILRVRQERYALSFYKYRRARRFGKILSLLPGVWMVALGNTMAWRHARSSSDIDFFIVAEEGRLWSVRFFCVLIAAMLRVRPTKSASADAFCLSFFASASALNLRSLAIEEDIYLPYWALSIVPLYDAGGVFERFKAANNWVLSNLPNSFFREPAVTAGRGPSIPSLPLLVENILKKLQLYLLPQDIFKKASLGNTEVLLSEQYLKFHTDDRRVIIRDTWMAKCKKIL